jgi:hypothetical protein
METKRRVGRPTKAEALARELAGEVRKIKKVKKAKKIIVIPARTKLSRGRPTKAQALEIKHAEETIARFRAEAEARKLKTRAQAAKKGHKKLRGVRRADPAFFEKIGSLGGTATGDRMGRHKAEFYRAISVLAHQVTREKRAEAKFQAEKAEREARRIARMKGEG